MNLPFEIAEIKLPLYQNAKDIVGVTTNVGSLVEQIRTGSNGIAEKQIAIRCARKVFDKSRTSNNEIQWKNLKKTLPGVCLSGFPGQGRKNDGFHDHTGLLQIDCDNVENPMALKQIISKDDHVLFCGISPSGSGVKAAMRIPKHPEVEHADSFKAAERYLKEKYKIKIDSACRNTARIMFLLHDKDLIINPTAYPLDVKKWIRKNQENKETRKIAIEQSVEETIERLQDALKVLDASDREKWIRYGHALKNSDLPGRFEIWHQWSSSASKGYHGEIDCKKTWDSFNPNNIHFETIFKDASMLGWKKPPWEKKKSCKTIEKMPFEGGHFELHKNAVYFRPPPKSLPNGNFEPQPPLWLCSRLEVGALSRNVNSEGWGKFLSWKDPDGELHEWACPAALLESVDGSEVRKELANKGLQISPNRQAREKLLIFIKLWPVKVRVRSVEKLGWFSGNYVTSDEVIGDIDKEPVVLQLDSPIKQANQQSGSLNDWQSTIGKWAKGNSRAQFAISCAVAAPLLDLAGVEGGGFNLRGASSSGKTSLLVASSSVYGLPEEAVRGWRSTANALEGLAALHNDGFLVLDEISEVQPEHAGEAAFMLANGRQKARANRTGSSRKVLTWKLLFLSSGEESLSNLLGRVKRKPTPGQELRLLDIPSDAGSEFGVFEELHEHKSGAALSLAFKDYSAKYHGKVGRYWLRWVVKNRGVLAEMLPKQIQKFVNKYVPEGSSGQILRAARRFALVSAAGESFTDAGLSGWENGEAQRAVVHCFQDWLSEYGVSPKEDQNILRQVRLFFEKHGSSRFEPMERAIDDNRIFHNRAGFWRHNDDEKEYLLLPNVFRDEICSGLDHKNVIRVLSNQKWFVTDNDGKHAQQNIRLPGLGQKRCYVFSSKEWD